MHGGLRRPKRSQACQSLLSQTPIEQFRIVDAFVFELSTVEMPEVRERMLANLRSVSDNLARLIAGGLGIADLPRAAKVVTGTMVLSATHCSTRTKASAGDAKTRNR